MAGNYNPWQAPPDYKNPVSAAIDGAVNYLKQPFDKAVVNYNDAGGGAAGVGAALRGDYDRSVDWLSRNVVEPVVTYPAQAVKPILESATNFSQGFTQGPDATKQQAEYQIELYSYFFK